MTRAHLLLSAVLAFCAVAAEEPVRLPEEVAQREQLFERFVREMSALRTPKETSGLSTNEQRNILRRLFDQVVIHPSFGLHWDEVPPPDVLDSNAMESVHAFVATNGWNMYMGRLVFTFGIEKPKPLRGLPWEAIRDRDFPAVTHSNILYVMLNGWHHAVDGVAYNPNTNRFPSAIRGFEHLGNHWYAWAHPEDPITLLQVYEGEGERQRDGAANGSQPIRSETNSTSSASARDGLRRDESAAGSRR